MKSQLAKGALYLGISSIVFIASGYITNVWIGRYLGPADYGKYGVIIALWNVVNMILIAGLPNAVSRFVAGEEKNAEGIFSKSLLIQLISICIVTIVYFWLASAIASLLKDQTLVPYIRLSSLILPFYSLYSLYLGFYNGQHRFGKQALISTVYSIIKVIGVIGLAYLFHLSGAFLGFVIAPFIALLFGFFIPKQFSKTISAKSLILFSLPLIGFTFFQTMLQSVDLFFVKSLIHTKEAAGFYTAAQNIARIPFFALSAFSLVLFPSIARSVSEGNNERTRNLIRTSLRLILLVLMPSILLVAATSGQVIQILFSKAYLPASSALSILIVASACLTLFSILASILNGAGMPMRSLLTSFVGTIVSSILCLLFIPMWGLRGAAIATLLSSVIALIVLSYSVFLKFKALISLNSIIRISFGSVIISLLAYTIKLPIIVLPLQYIVLLGLYGLILLLSGEIKKTDWQLARSLLSLK